MKIYIGNFSRTMTEDALRNLFEQFGEVISVKLIKNHETGELRGFGFVEMADAEKAQEAIAALDGSEQDGQRLRVNEARPQEDRGSFRPRSPRQGGSSSGFGGRSRSGGDSRSGSGFGSGNRDRGNRFNSGGGWR